MTIKQQGGIFGRNPTFNDVSVEDTLLASNQIAVGTNTPVAGMVATQLMRLVRGQSHKPRR